MTKHSDTRKPTDIVVVDGSNIATEGRSTPSLSQLNDAVTSFLEETPEATITVVVDATFGHRIAKKETKEFDEAVANNELVAPAGWGDRSRRRVRAQHRQQGRGRASSATTRSRSSTASTRGCSTRAA